MDSPISPTESPSQGRFNHIFHHGSEESNDPSQAQQHEQAGADFNSPTPKPASPEQEPEVASDSEDEVVLSKRLCNQNSVELCDYLRSLGCGQDTLDVVFEDDISGKIFVKAVLSSECLVFLQADLGIVKRVTRIKITDRLTPCFCKGRKSFVRMIYLWCCLLEHNRNPCVSGSSTTCYELDP